MKKSIIAATLATMGAASMPLSGDACTRVEYVGEDSLIVIGRSLDWKTPIPTNLYVYPRGMKMLGSDQPNPVSWTSKYGAVYAVGYDGGITEGMNEKGVCINGLFCKGTIYNNEESHGKPVISLAMFVAWLLGQNGSTPEVVDVLKRSDFQIQGATFDGGTVSTLHWGITDAEGRSAILEFDNGNVRVYDPDSISAMTNDPNWPQMSAIVNYWRKIGGTHMLPGTVSSPDRCVRADFFTNRVEKTGDADLGVSIVRSIMGTVSVPYTYLVPGEPNVSSTQWRSYANLRDKRYYFDIVTNPGFYYVDLNKVDLSRNGHVLRFDTSIHKDVVGDVTKLFEASEPFKPMY